MCKRFMIKRWFYKVLSCAIQIRRAIQSLQCSWTGYGPCSCAVSFLHLSFSERGFHSSIAFFARESRQEYLQTTGLLSMENIEFVPSKTINHCLLMKLSHYYVAVTHHTCHLSWLDASCMHYYVKKEIPKNYCLIL